MPHVITVLPSRTTFEISNEDTILTAAMRSNVALPYSCKDGTCGKCKAIHVSGDIEMAANTALTPQEKTQNILLTCRATVRSDVHIEVNLEKEALFPVKKMPARIATLNKITTDVAILKLQLPASETFEYRSGQYIDIVLKNGIKRSYSIASAPVEHEKTIELHIKHMAGGVFTDQLFHTLKEKDILRIEGPYGTFCLQQDSEAPIIFIVSGTGFAPAKAMLEILQKNNINRNIHLYWGVRRPIDLYHHEQLLHWESTIPNFKYTPVVSDATPDDNWTGKTGFVHKAVADDHINLSGTEVYACGSPLMIHAAHELYTTTHDLSEDSFFSDIFLSELDKSTANSTRQ